MTPYYIPPQQHHHHPATIPPSNHPAMGHSTDPQPHYAPVLMAMPAPPAAYPSYAGWPPQPPIAAYPPSALAYVGGGCPLYVPIDARGLAAIAPAPAVWSHRPPPPQRQHPHTAQLQPPLRLYQAPPPPSLRPTAALASPSRDDGPSTVDISSKVAMPSPVTQPAAAHERRRIRTIIPKPDTTSHFHIFVGDLSAEVDTDMLRTAFQPYGTISDCRVVRDQHQHHSKGYGFVAFRCRTEASDALLAMNGRRLGARAIRTNWATRRPPAVRVERAQPPRFAFDAVYGQTGPTNSTIYCGAMGGTAISERLVHERFGRYGRIEEVRLFAEKGFAFVRFATKQAATQAIVDEGNAATATALAGTESDGQPVRCSWSREVGVAMGQPVAGPYGFDATGMGGRRHEADLQIPFVSGNDVDY